MAVSHDSDYGKGEELVYEEKPEAYFEIIREDLIALVPEGPHRILDVGAASGNTGLALKRLGKASEVVGVELCEEFGKEAGEKIDKVIIGDIEKFELPFPKGYFDYIICGDVLEHLIDPWTTLKKLRSYLSDNGYIIASIPNIRCWIVIKDLVFYGKWEYQWGGVLDKTHLRFFTRRSIYQLFDSAGFKVDRMIFKFGRKSRILNALTLQLFKEFFPAQFLVVASKRS